MKRKISDSLIEWKNSKNRMPLIVNGARQVGKTYIIEQFGHEHFENYVLLNMEMEGTLREFIDKDLAPQRIIQYIEGLKQQKITAGKTLIFFDEIQACERALTLLKYFCEVIPIEVKKGRRNRSKSLGVFAEKYKSPCSIRISAKNFGFENNIKSVPLYAVWCI